VKYALTAATTLFSAATAQPLHATAYERLGGEKRRKDLGELLLEHFDSLAILAGVVTATRGHCSLRSPFERVLIEERNVIAKNILNKYSSHMSFS
jgi:hypothetical protein